jgi:hypothetical protein
MYICLIALQQCPLFHFCLTDQQFEVDASGDHFDADLDEKIETNGDNNEDEQQDFEQQQEEQQLEVEQQEEEETHQTESENTEGHSKYIVNMHGLPYSISEEEILKFLDGNSF